MLDSGSEIDIDVINANIDEADIVSLYFPFLRKTLLIDTRSNGSVGPFVGVVEMVSDSGERLRSLRQLRPQFPRPNSITLIPWQRRVCSLTDTGVWGRLMARLDACGGGDCLETAARCFDELCRLERQVLSNAITGEQHWTLWGRRGLGDNHG